MLFNRRLAEFDKEMGLPNECMNKERRTISELIETKEKWQELKEDEERRKREFEQKHAMEQLANKEYQLWEKVDILIKEKKINSYDMAIGILMDLQSLAEYRGTLEEFKERIIKIKKVYSNLIGLKNPLQEARLISE